MISTAARLGLARRSWIGSLSRHNKPPKLCVGQHESWWQFRILRPLQSKDLQSSYWDTPPPFNLTAPVSNEVLLISDSSVKERTM